MLNNNTILDLIFFSCNLLLNEKSCDPDVPIDQYHPALNILLLINMTIPYCNHNHSFLNFHETNFKKACSFLSSSDWYSTFMLYSLILHLLHFTTLYINLSLISFRNVNLLSLRFHFGTLRN